MNYKFKSADFIWKHLSLCLLLVVCLSVCLPAISLSLWRRLTFSLLNTEDNKLDSFSGFRLPETDPLQIFLKQHPPLKIKMEPQPKQQSPASHRHTCFHLSHYSTKENKSDFEPAAYGLITKKNPVANLIKPFTIISYDARVVLTTNLPILQL